MKILVSDLRYTYRHSDAEVLHGVNIEIASGDYACIAGPNGSGKSTFLKTICALTDLTNSSGSVYWNGQELGLLSRTELAKLVSYVPGGFIPKFSCSVEEFVLQSRFAWQPLWSQPSKTDQELSLHSLERLGIADLKDKLITEISTGQLQLVMLARSLTQQPKALLLDEGMANLDLKYQDTAFKILQEENGKGVTILMISHDLNMAAEFCPKFMWMQSGNILGYGATETMLTSEWIEKIYSTGKQITVGVNPKTGKPKYFWSHVNI